MKCKEKKKMPEKVELWNLFSVLYSQKAVCLSSVSIYLSAIFFFQIRLRAVACGFACSTGIRTYNLLITEAFLLSLFIEAVKISPDPCRKIQTNLQ